MCPQPILEVREEATMVNPQEGITQRDPNRGLRERLRRILPADTTTSALELEVAVKDLQDLARNRLA